MFIVVTDGGSGALVVWVVMFLFTYHLSVLICISFFCEMFCVRLSILLI